jgi:hypothetical protein
MTKEASPGIHSPVGFLLKRAGEFYDSYTYTKGKRRRVKAFLVVDTPASYK